MSVDHRTAGGEKEGGWGGGVHMKGTCSHHHTIEIRIKTIKL